MSSVMNVLGIALIVFGIVAVVYMVMNYTRDDTMGLGPEPLLESPPLDPPRAEPAPAGTTPIGGR